MRRILSALALVLLSISSGSVFAQSPDGSITGIVLDPDTKSIAGAEIIAVNDLTGVKYVTATNSDGIYSLPSLPPGTYRIQVSKLGFKTLIKPDITLNVQDAVSINFTLPIGAASVVVTVEGGAPLVNTANGSVSTVIDRQFVGALPLNGRSFNTLLQLTPGVVIAPANSSPGQFSVAGQRTDANNFEVDGVSANFGVAPRIPVNESGTGGAQAFSAVGGTSSLVSVEALQEFRVETSSFAPEFGRTPGGQVMLTTRSGTDLFHGGMYEYFRNNVLDANDWFANAAGEPRAAERHNDFGGYVGGPIAKSKTFFFFSYEGARLRLPQTSEIQVPSVFARTAASSQIAPLLSAFPIPNGLISGAGYTAQFTGTYSNQATLNATSIRVDHTFNGRFSIFGRYNHAPSSTLDRTFSLSTLESISVNTDTATVGVNMLFDGGITNTMRANYSQQKANSVYTLDSYGGAVAPNPALLLGSLPSEGNVADFVTFGTAAIYRGPAGQNRTRQLNFVDELSFTKGTHLLKFGGDYRAIFLDIVPGRFSVFNIGTSVQSLVTTGLEDLSVASERPAYFLAQSLSLFAQDQWKLNSRLTMTYGLRWEWSPAPSARGGTTVAAWNQIINPADIVLAPSGTPLWSTQWRNFAPRVGIAYRPTGGDDFVIRAGAGIFYDLGFGSVANLAQSFPNFSSAFYIGVPAPVTDTSAYLPVESGQPPYPSVHAFSPNLSLPRSYQWNVAVEKSFGGRQVLSATYVGQAGRDLLRQEALYQPNPDFSSDFILTKNDARSNYNALQLQYRMPLKGQLQALFNYTYAHSLDNSSNDVIAGLSNKVISAANDYASSDFDVRHAFSGALAWEIPSPRKSTLVTDLSRGWSIETVVVVRTGFPFNANVYSASPDPGGIALSRPDRAPGESYWLRNPSAPGGQVLNPAAFVVPTTPRQGTEGRNDIAGFGLTQIDLSVGRKFRIREQVALQFRADAFNLFNHPNFTNPEALPEFGAFYLQSQSMLNQGLGGLNPLFQEGGPRSLQLSLKLSF